MAVNLVTKIDDTVKINSALISVSDKRELDVLVPGLLAANAGIKLLSTGGTYSAIKEQLGNDGGRTLLQVSDYTGQPEMQGGLVKTLDFKIYLGLLSESYNPAHRADLERTEAIAIDLVVVNLYPFEITAAASDSTIENARANIDIGGPSMIRAAAKNFHRVAVVTDPGDYKALLADIANSSGCTTLRHRFWLAKKAFVHTASYDSAISGYLADQPYRNLADSYSIGSTRPAKLD